MKYSIIDKSDVDNMIWEDLVTTSNFLSGKTEYTLKQIISIINDVNNNWIYVNPDDEEGHV